MWPFKRARSMPRHTCVSTVVLLLLLLSVARACVAQSGCQVPNCRTCSADDEFFCEVCAGADFINSNGQCSPRGTCGITACETCEEGTIARCQTCEPGYVRTVNGFCASLVECDMDKCESQEALRSRIAQTTVACRVEESAKGEEAYVCVATAAETEMGRSGSWMARVPWWGLAATVTSVCAMGVGRWMLPQLRGRA